MLADKDEVHLDMGYAIYLIVVMGFFLCRGVVDRKMSKISGNFRRISEGLILVEDDFFLSNTLTSIGDTLIQNLRTIHTTQFFGKVSDDFARCYVFHLFLIVTNLIFEILNLVHHCDRLPLNFKLNNTNI